MLFIYEIMFLENNFENVNLFKLIMFLGALDYLLPAEYVKTLRVLHSSAPQSTFKDVLSVLKEDLKSEPYDIFESIEDHPVGTASLAQVLFYFRFKVFCTLLFYIFLI